MKIVRNTVWIGLAGLLVTSFGAMAADKPVPSSTGGAAAPSGAQILVMAKPSKRGGALVSVEFYSDGTTAGVHVDLDLGSLEKASPDLSKCGTAKLSAGADWAGGCSMVDGVVRFVVINTSLEPLAKGWHTLGTFRANAVPKTGITAKTVAAGDTKGQAQSVGYDFSWVE